MAYKMVFDPPVPAVVTIPTSIVKLNGANDWKTESSALQYLLTQTVEPRNELERRAEKRKRPVECGLFDMKMDTDLRALIAAIEVKGNKAVHLNQPVFTLQHPLPPGKKSGREPPQAQVENDVPDQSGATATVSSESALRNAVLVQQFSLNPLCERFLLDHRAHLQQEELRKALAKKRQLDRLWRQRLSLSDASLQTDLADIIQNTQMHLKELAYGKERAEMVVDEKYILDAEETEKRLQTATEKAKSHVINMFEENRRQYELQVNVLNRSSVGN